MQQCWIVACDSSKLSMWRASIRTKTEAGRFKSTNESDSDLLRKFPLANTNYLDRQENTRHSHTDLDERVFGEQILDSHEMFPVVVGEQAHLVLLHGVQDVEHLLEVLLQLETQLQPHTAGPQQLQQVVPQPQHVILPARGGGGVNRGSAGRRYTLTRNFLNIVNSRWNVYHTAEKSVGKPLFDKLSIQA